MRVLRDNGLSIVLGLLFSVCLAAQSLAGHRAYNEERLAHREPAVSFRAYLRSSHFAEATFENWESEFLQMAAYLLLTVSLYQRGSAESRDPDAPPTRDPATRRKRDLPWPVRRGGIALLVYQHSLSLAFVVLFLASIGGHAVAGARRYSEDQVAHGGTPLSALDYVRTSQFWFESFQNWQSEFLAIGSMVVLSIFLRQKDSPESKRVDSAHSETGK
jgi:hypothetical protein